MAVSVQRQLVLGSPLERRLEGAEDTLTFAMLNTLTQVSPGV